MKITMEVYGIRGWEFSLNGAKYRTDKDGYGLWQWMLVPGVQYPPNHKEYRQVSGTCQFALSNDRRRAYQQIRREFAA